MSNAAPETTPGKNTAADTIPWQDKLSCLSQTCLFVSLARSHLTRSCRKRPKHAFSCGGPACGLPRPFRSPTGAIFSELSRYFFYRLDASAAHWLQFLFCGQKQSIQFNYGVIAFRLSSRRIIIYHRRAARILEFVVCSFEQLSERLGFLRKA